MALPAFPPGGFKVVVSASTQQYIEAEIAENFRVSQFWRDILDRIRITALDESTELASKSVPMFTFIADGAPEFHLPTIQIVFEVFDDTLTITNALVYQEADYEGGPY